MLWNIGIYVTFNATLIKHSLYSSGGTAFNNGGQWMADSCI